MSKISIITASLLLATAVAYGADGTPEQAQSVITKVKEDMKLDSRQTVCDFSAYVNGEGALVICGSTSEQAVHDATVDAMNRAGLSFVDSTTVYPTDKWALVRISVASLRTAGRHAAEMATQALLGTPLRILDSSGEWWRVQTPDGYIAYVPSSSVVAKTAADMTQWRSAARYVVTDPYQVRVYKDAYSVGLRDVVTDLVNGCIVEAYDDQAPGVGQNGRIHVKLPDGRAGYIDSRVVTPIEKWATQPFDANLILDTAYSMEGSPYLWGGNSTKATDCSGLAKLSYYANGIIIMRDASQQALTGTRIEAADWRTCQAGDLLFFGSRNGRVTHVAIYDSDGNYVHSSGRVKRNSVDPASEAYLTTPFLYAVRIHGNEGSRGITRACDHPWYFQQH